MGMYRAYESDSGVVSISATTAVPALYFAAAAAADCNIVKIKVAIEAVSSPSPPSNGSVLFQLSKVTGTVAGGGAVTPTPIGQTTLAAQTTVKSGSTALTGLTQGIEYWAHPLPFTAGAAWADDHENTGLEVNIAASGLYCFYFTAASGAGTGMNARIIVWHAE